MYNFLRRLFHLLPSFFRLKIKSVWLRRKKKKLAVNLRRKKKRVRLANGAVTIVQFVEELRRLGIDRGDVIFMQVSFNELYTLEASPNDILTAIKSLIGPDGSLFMPAYTSPKEDEDWVFDVERTPTYTGIVNEVFRRSDGVLRSIHPRHSICGVGPIALDVLSNHEKCSYADGVGSPFDKLRKYSNAKILTLGLPRGFVSFLHWLEDYEPSKLPFRVHEEAPRSYSVVAPDTGAIVMKDYPVRAEVARRLNLEMIFQHLAKDSWAYKNLNGTDIYLYFLPNLSRDLLNARDIKNVIHYDRGFI
jgi:aminoglycoside N3'-acetyltransferase